MSTRRRSRWRRPEPPPLALPSDETLREIPKITETGQKSYVVRIGLRTNFFADLYHHAMTVRWPVFLGVASAIYLLVNVLFAGLYMLDLNGIVGEEAPGSFLDAFFFSIQTMATIGYGHVYPVSTYVNSVVTVETIVSLFTAALITGLLFARFSRPTARVRFARHAVVGPINGVTTLSIRTANERRNQILEADVQLSLLRFERMPEGGAFRRFYDLKLVRSHTPVFSLSFQIMHPIDEDSPLAHATRESLATSQCEILVTVIGLDETMSQTVYARWSYRADEILWGRRFADLFGMTQDGRFAIDYRRFDDTLPV